jgi:hypothetical protein
MTDFTAKLDTLRLKDSNLSKQIRNILESVQPHIDVLSSQRKAVREQTDNLIVDLIKDQGVEVLYNVDSAREVYTEAWNRGTGSGKISSALSELFKSFSYLDSDRHCVNRDDNNQAVSNLRIFIPEVYDLEYLKVTSSIAERILAVQMEVMKESDNKPGVEVAYDPGYSTIRINSGEDGFYLTGESHDYDESFETLFDAVKAAVREISEDL